MNSGTTNTDLNDMLVDFTNYVNAFYGDYDDVLYPMNHEKTGKRVTKSDILGVSVWQKVWIWATIGSSGAKLTEREMSGSDGISHR